MYAAIDIGGTKTLIAVFSEKGKILEEFKFPTPKAYDAFSEELKKALASLKHSDFQRAVVAIPGRVDRVHGVAVAFGNLPWKNVPIQADCEQILHCPVTLENDAKLAALAEALLVQKTYRKALYITVSTGIGGGLIIDGKIAKDFEDIEIGHMLLEHQGQLKRWEEFASGKAIVTKFGKKASEITDETAWYWVARNIAIGLIDVIATLNPEVIIIGGGVGSHFEKYKNRLLEELKIYENPLVQIPPIVQAQHPEEAVVYGCFALAKQQAPL